ncbi:DUF2946 domain-containing protein [Noviherbaspirillum galbum]|uniref:DUF2946 domain-containing protein n=1 Tax=Noviherbaspirillum galbum TaxID=2709383 RepID=A0A6B3SKD2_9BURK|nr:DUF2946 domain-containing protein [Noviherbaspirillum galbum]NEX61217.1 DUF2946 domain-containing protein [Noviherbaspirillum galbum]
MFKPARLRRFVQHCAAWLALCAMLFASLMPALSHATGQGKSGAPAFSDICSVTSPASSGKSPSLPSSPGLPMAHADHCLLCSLHGVDLGPSAPCIVPLPLAAFAAERPPLFYAAPRSLFIWASARSRAPPAA